MRCAACITLEPLRVDHASEMVEVLGDPALYEFTGGESPTLDELTARYAHQIGGASPDGAEEWRNWIVGSVATTQAIGYVQATIRRTQRSADLAWVIGSRWWGRGYGKTRSCTPHVSLGPLGEPRRVLTGHQVRGRVPAAPELCARTDDDAAPVTFRAKGHRGGVVVAGELTGAAAWRCRPCVPERAPPDRSNRTRCRTRRTAPGSCC